MQNHYKMNSITYYDSPLGWVEIQASCDAVTSIAICNERKKDICSDSPILKDCVRQLDEYFNGRRTNFDFPMNQRGTAFQQSVWKVLAEIPFGKTVSYGDVAKKLNAPKSSRAVGAACGKNNLWIVIPCHRVKGSDGSLTGYAGGLDCKRWLLEHEAKKK